MIVGYHNIKHIADAYYIYIISFLSSVLSPYTIFISSICLYYLNYVVAIKWQTKTERIFGVSLVMYVHGGDKLQLCRPR